MMTSLKERSWATHFCQNHCHFYSFMHSGPLVKFSTISWHQRRRRRTPRVIRLISLETRATFRRGDVSKVGVTPSTWKGAQNGALSMIKNALFSLQEQKTVTNVGDPTFWSGAAPNFCSSFKGNWNKHSRSFPTPPLMSGDDRKRCERSCKSISEKPTRCLWKI